MTLSVIPVVFLSILLILTSVDKGQPVETVKSNSVQKVYNKELNKRVLKQYENQPKIASQKDESAIFKYITTKFKKVSQDDAKKISKNLVDYGKKYNLDPKFVAAVIARESGFRKDAVSVTGAKGLGQIKDFNYKALKIRDPFKIEENVSGTAQYLKKMIRKWKEKPMNTTLNEQKKATLKQDDIKLALASYYKGFTAVNKEGVDTKTQKYVDDIIDYYNEILNY